MSPAAVALLFVFFSLSTLTSSQDPQVCLNCWNELCGSSNQNWESICPCFCINSTQYSITEDKCDQAVLSNEPPSVCCPKADQYIATHILPQLVPLYNDSAAGASSSNSCTPYTVFNQLPSMLNIDDYEHIPFTDREFVLYGTPFTCTGCIDSVTIYHLVNAPGVRNMTIQIWREYQNVTDNSTVLIGKYNSTTENYTIKFDSANTVEVTSDYSYTIGTPNRDICFSSGDIYGAIIPDTFNGLNILREKATPATPQVYMRSLQSCNSLENIFFNLSSQHNRIMMSVNVTRAIDSSTVTVTPSTVDVTPYYSSIIPSDSITVITSTLLDNSIPLIPSPSQTTSRFTVATASKITTISISSSPSYRGSSSSTVIINSTPSAPQTTSSPNTIIYISAGVIVVVILALIVVVLALICCFIRYNYSKGHLSIAQKPMEMTSDSLDFQRHRAVNPHEYVQGSTSNISTRATPPDRRLNNPRSDLVESMLIHDYDHPDALNFVEFNRSREMLNVSSRRQSPSGVGTANDTHTYMPMSSSSVRTHTPSTVSVGSDRSHYSHPRPVDRYQSPSTYQRYDTPRSLAGSSTTSEYDDPKALDKTPRPQQRIIKGNVRAQDEIPPSSVQPEHFYDQPTQTQVIPARNHYFVLDNPNEATGQAEQRHPHYHELEPPSSTIPRSNHYFVLEKGSGYHVPTNSERQSFLAQGTFPNIQEEHQFFLNKPIYSEPPEEPEHIYEQLNQFKCREIPSESIMIEDHLGEGQFGTVFSGIWELAGRTKKPVAIKRLKASATEEQRAKFLREGARQMQFCHANVVKLHGMVTVKDPPLIIQELMRQGDLKTYLKSCRPVTTSSDSKQTRPIPSPQQLLTFCRDIASGMRHLANKKYVHRDLAARNVLLNDNLICKIADFGMTRTLDHVYDLNKVEQIPLRWTAPEAFQGRMYSEQSDVYSYGMVLYEIWSLGRKPFPNHKQNQEIIDFITQNMLMPPPPGCPRNIYTLMVKCWNPMPGDRLSFNQIYNDYLNAKDEALLTWDRDDLDECSPRAAEIGAPLQEGYSLYIDLQHEYRN